MSYVLYLCLSDDIYNAIASLAAERRQTPEDLIGNLVDETWERECARYDAAFENDPDWQESARRASEAAQAGQQSDRFQSTEEFLKVLGESGDDFEVFPHNQLLGSHEAD